MNARRASRGMAVLFVGLGIGIVGISMASSMGEYAVIYDEGKYYSYMTIAVIGFIVGACGLGEGVYGFTAKDEKPVPPTAQEQHRYILTDAPAFCPYCGTSMQGALKCSNCGRFFA